MADLAGYGRNEDELREDREVAGGREDLYGPAGPGWVMLIGTGGEPGEILTPRFLQSRGLPIGDIADVLRATLAVIEAGGEISQPAKRHFVLRERDLPQP